VDQRQSAWPEMSLNVAGATVAIAREAAVEVEQLFCEILPEACKGEAQNAAKPKLVSK